MQFGVWGVHQTLGLALVVPLATLLSACAIGRVALIQRSQLAVIDCKARYPVLSRTTIMARDTCIEEAVDIRRGAFPNDADVIDASQTSGRVISEKYQAGQISDAEFNAAILGKAAELTTILNCRRHARERAQLREAVFGESGVSPESIARLCGRVDGVTYQRSK
ncbi:MAG TPA: hypothetical protein VGJ20_30240 [Xanthobacteraceae bacterium]|jgi:hypothetical protein